MFCHDANQNETCFPQSKNCQSYRAKLPACGNSAHSLIADLEAFSFPTWKASNYFSQNKETDQNAFLGYVKRDF